MKNRGKGKQWKLMVILAVLLIFTAGISWFFGYQSREGHDGNQLIQMSETQKLTVPLISEAVASLTVSSVDTVVGQENISTGQAEEQTIPHIRVVIHTSDYGSIWHDEIKISSDESFILSWEGGEQLFSAGDTLSVKKDDIRLQESSIHIRGEGGFKLSNIHRECGHPVYPGELEICLKDGRMALINELNLEQYLCLVVPGEMPSSYGVEALKVQAVCARSYAWCNLENPGYENLGAHVDDSVNYQVYNNQSSTDNSRKAVEETCGQLLTHQGEVVETYYFSTSCGHTTDMSIWKANPEDYPHYPAAAVAEGREGLNLRDEEAFRYFLQWYGDSFDSDGEFYRWEISLDKEELTESIDTYLEKHGMESIGEVQDIRVTSRGSGGIVQEMTVIGRGGKVVIERQGNVREALGNRKMKIVLNDGSKVNGWKTLPSAFFYLEEICKGEKLTGYHIHGGGYGHGVGMSQHGVSKMCAEGYKYDEIIYFFYPGTALVENYGV